MVNNLKICIHSNPHTERYIIYIKTKYLHCLEALVRGQVGLKVFMKSIWFEKSIFFINHRDGNWKESIIANTLVTEIIPNGIIVYLVASL